MFLSAIRDVSGVSMKKWVLVCRGFWRFERYYFACAFMRKNLFHAKKKMEINGHLLYWTPFF